MEEQAATQLFRLKEEDFEVEYDILPPSPMDSRRIEIYRQIDSIDERLSLVQQRVHELNNEIDRLTNHTDGADYAIAVSCGILTGLIDSFFVGEWNFKDAKAISNKKINEEVIAFAKKDPDYLQFVAKKKNNDPNRLANAIEFLENKYPLPGDNSWNVKSEFISFAKENGFSGSKYEAAVEYMNTKLPKKGGWSVEENFITMSTHHLDDFCHHPTFIGLICCLVVQFADDPHSIYFDRYGNRVKIPITVNENGKFVGNNPVSKLFSGVINWFINAAHTIANRKGHLMSDMAGSMGSAKNGNSGMGIPGSIMSTLKELSALPCFRETNFGENLRKAFQNGIGSSPKQVDLGLLNSLFEGASSKFDLRTEMAVKSELKRQSLPVIINEVLVRGVYFIRRLITELKTTNSFDDVNWKNLIPFRNRTIVRMMTIASGTFTAVDMADAAIRGAVKSEGNGAVFAKEFILHVNFVGVGRFAIAVGADIKMGIDRHRRESERMRLNSEMLMLTNAKVLYKEADMWISAQDAGQAINKVYSQMNDVAQSFATSFHETEQDLDSLTDDVMADFCKNNAEATQEFLDILES